MMPHGRGLKKRIGGEATSKVPPDSVPRAAHHQDKGHQAAQDGEQQLPTLRAETAQRNKTVMLSAAVRQAAATAQRCGLGLQQGCRFPRLQQSRAAAG